MLKSKVGSDATQSCLRGKLPHHLRDRQTPPASSLSWETPGRRINHMARDDVGSFHRQTFYMVYSIPNYTKNNYFHKSIHANY